MRRGFSAANRAALVDLYEHAGGGHWLNPVGWLTDAEVHLWFGVTAEGGLVTVLTLNNNGLQGEIPASLGSLTALTVLIIGENQLGGEIPSSLGSLTALTVMDLGENQLSGEIPLSIGFLQALTVLNLAENQLSGAIPSSLGFLTALTELDLRQNELSGRIPESLGSLTALTVLDLGENHLSGAIPSSLGFLEALTELDLAQNQLSGEIPASIGSLTALTMLDLGENQLSGEIPETVGFLTALMVVVLGGNQLSGEIPNSLGLLTALTVLELRGNQLSGVIPESLGSLTALTVLILGENRFSGEIPSSLGELTALTELILGRNMLSGEIPSSLGSLTALTVLDLGENQLIGVIPLTLCNLDSLEYLDVSGNNMDDAPPPLWGRANIMFGIQANQHAAGTNNMSHSFVWRMIDWMVTLWHFLVPVADDITNYWILRGTNGGGKQPLWWACVFALVVADAERLYTAVYALGTVMTMLVSVVFALLLLFILLPLWTFDLLATSFGLYTHSFVSTKVFFEQGILLAVWTPVRLLGGGQQHAWPNALWFFWDAATWTILGSRSRSALMSRGGQGGDSVNDSAGNSRVSLWAIDIFLRWHPYRYLGWLVFQYPQRRHIRLQRRCKESRRAMAMVRAVGETLLVDSLFLALGVLNSLWHRDIYGVTALSAFFCILELVTELQYYISEAENYLLPTDREMIPGMEEATRRLLAREDSQDEGAAVHGRVQPASFG